MSHRTEISEDRRTANDHSADHNIWYLSTNFYGADKFDHWGLMIRREPQLGTLHNYVQAPFKPDGILHYQKDIQNTQNLSLYGGIIHLRTNETTTIRKIEEQIAEFDRITIYPEGYRCAPWVFNVLEHLENLNLIPKGHSKFPRGQRLTNPSIIKENVRKWGGGEWFDGYLAKNEGQRASDFEADAKFEQKGPQAPREVGRLDPA